MPLPPAHLARRVGINDPGDPLRSFEELGRSSREMILDLLPPGWTFAGKRVLDFGCGPGKVLRYFLAEAADGTFYGCDIDAPSIEWLERHLSPPLEVFVNEERPPLPFEDDRLDLVWAMSVFTHIVDAWSDWLVELRRILNPGGLLIASFLGRGVCEQLTGEPWVEDNFGMNVFGYGQPWDEGGPNVLLSPWWIRAHWGRAFDIVDLRDSGSGHGFVVLRKPASGPAPSPRDLERPEAGERREVLALQHDVEQLRREVRALRSAPAEQHSNEPWDRDRATAGRSPANAKILRVLRSARFERLSARYLRRT